MSKNPILPWRWGGTFPMVPFVSSLLTKLILPPPLWGCPETWLDLGPPLGMSFVGTPGPAQALFPMSSSFLWRQ